MIDNPERVTYFAATDSRGKRVPFGIKAKDRDRHMYVIGKTGMGKSTLLENMAIQDIRNGEGLAFIDPHGGTVERLLEYVPEDRIKDVVYFAPFDMEHPIAFNVMEDVGYDKRHLVVSGLMATFKKIWEDAWSARMEYILTNTLLALLEYPDATLLGVNRMYTDKAYRQKVVDNVKDPVVKDFWTKEFANYGDRYTQEATPAIQNKIGQFTGNPLIRNIIGQPKSSFDIRTMMDERKILIINLSKGLVGETNMRLLGSMLTTRIFLGAMSRADLPAPKLAKLPHFYFYVDEFQNFANETFAEILSEARKYKLNLVIAHQYIEQMEEEVRDAVFGNVGTTVVFRVGPFDAEVLETVFMPKFTKEDIVSLDKRQVYMTLMIDGVGSAPFSAVTIPPIEAPKVSYRDRIIEASRAQFTAPRAGIESAIMEELAASAASEAPPDARMRKKPVPASRPPMLREEIRPALNASFAPLRPPKPPVRESAPRQEEVPAPFPPAGNAPQMGKFNFPKRESAPSPSREGTTREQARPLFVPPTKSPDDLKAILRTMTAKTSAEREQKQTLNQQSLKGALAGVLEKSGRKEEARPAVPPVPAAPAPAAAEPPRAELPVPTPPPAQKKPFEVPEDTLRKILKGDT
ncbi:MAG TPA: type IV secretion system DNA-binding domain-containing protein [Candidatus Paceibacterota bacterium]|nr:type IV secretion system DNA-binding domain-containing protein [Candidatus Paceibacterota bacterium]